MQTVLFPILSSLRDVEGVEGAFVISDDGALLDKDLPAMFDPQLFLEVGPRIVRLKETFASGGDDMDSCMIRFSDFKLFIRAMQQGFLCILSSVAVNMPALRMGVQLAQRRILAELAPADSGSPSSPPGSLAPPSWPTGAYGPGSQPPAPSSKPALTYRGRPVK
jgi:predicted regulator of Ras-like GTPase activity (Roadblock/LC7/MglB family)